MIDNARGRSLDRRTFVRRVGLYAASIAVSSRAVGGQRLAGTRLTIGMILPGAPTDAVTDVIAGIELGIDEAARSAALFQKHVTLARKSFVSAQDAGLSATNLILGEHATVIIGGGNDDDCRAIGNACVERGAVFMNVVSRSDDLRRSNCTKFVVHVEASDAMYLSARKIAAESEASSSSDCEVMLWHSSLERYGASQLNDRFNAKSRRPMTGSSWAGWMAVKAATESFFRAGVNDGESIAAYMNGDTTQFDGHKGAPLSFRSWDHQLRQPLYCVSKASGSLVARDVPDLSRSSRPARELLDELGDDKSASLCKSPDR